MHHTKKPLMVVVGTRVSEELADEVFRLARKNHVTVADIIRDGLHMAMKALSSGNSSDSCENPSEHVGKTPFIQ